MVTAASAASTTVAAAPSAVVPAPAAVMPAASAGAPAAMPVMAVMAATAGAPEAAGITQPVAIRAHSAVPHDTTPQDRSNDAGKNDECADCDDEDGRAVHGTPAYALTGCAGMSLRGSSHEEDRAHRAGISVNGGKPQEKRRGDRFLGGGIEEQPVPVSSLALANEVSESPI
jgi:hypothetical protein